MQGSGQPELPPEECHWVHKQLPAGPWRHSAEGAKFQSAVVESGSEDTLVQWVQAMEAVWAETHNRLRLQEEKSLRAWGPVTEDGDEDMLWAKVSEMLTETCSRPEGFNPKSRAEQCWSAAKLIQEWIGVPMLEALGRHVTALRARLPGVFLCEAQVPEALSEQWYKITQAKQEAEGLVRLNRHKFISKAHAEQVMSEEFKARQDCDDRWLKLETREGLWRGQAQAVVQAMLKEVTAQNVQGVGAQVGMLLYGAVAVEWAAVQQAVTEKTHRLGELAVLAEQHVLVATRAEGGEVRHVQGDATKPKLSGAHNIVAHVCSDVGAFGAGFAAAVAA